MEKYETIEKIGQGGFGTVFKARERSNNSIVAVKRVKKEAGTGEIMIQSMLHHPNLVSLVEVVREETFVFLVMEFFPMDLFDQLHHLPTGKMLEPELVKSYLYQISDAVNYCHQKGIMHRDLKTCNLLVNLEGVIKVADFGLACSFTVPSHLSSAIGTLIYRAPEMLLGSKRYSSSVDIWAIGCIFAEMAMAKFLFYGHHQIIVIYDIFNQLGTPTEESWRGVTSLPFYQTAFPCWTKNRLAKRMKTLDETGLDLLQKCLQYNPADRITAKEILEHKFFEGFNKTNAAAK
uniref:Protein kinase domain-containing protein n=2 Tax=Anopheles atroparvus TaxID=41427 RepID=A0AAG5DWI2_ANOAO